MNRGETTLVVILAVLVVLTLLFPPFRMVYKEGAVGSAGYGFILSPPHGGATVNVGLLLMEWLGILIVGALIWFGLRRAAGKSTSRAA